MKRRELLKTSAGFGLIAAMHSLSAGKLYGEVPNANSDSGADKDKDRALNRPDPLLPPAKDPIPVAFVISDGAVVIDFSGPWEVFQDSHSAHGDPFFHLYTVAEVAKPVTASGGLKIVPDYTFQNAPSPKVIVIPAQNHASPAMLEWIRMSAKSADLTMSVCTGAYILAQTGLLSGKAATTHHSSYTEFAVQFPNVELKR